MPSLPPTERAAPPSSVDTTLLSLNVEDTGDSRPSKKNKKRRREAEGADDAVEETEKKKKKKKKKHRTEDDAATGEVSADPSPMYDGEVNGLPPVESQKKKKKDKKKRSQVIDSQIDPSLQAPEEEQDPTTALLSQIVEATTAKGQQMPRPQPQYDPILVPPEHLSFGLQDHAHTLFPTGSLPIQFSDLDSNAAVLLALQSLDMSKITSVLKNLGAPEDPSVVPTLPPSQTPVPPGPVLVATNPGPSVVHHKRLLDMSLPGTAHQTNPDHAHLLATKWLSTTKLSELVKSEGLVFKKGKFSAIEEKQLQDAIDNYRVTRGLTESHIHDLIYPQSDKAKDNAFWSELTHYAPRAVMQHGQQWEKISPLVGRMSSDCRDRYRNHIVNREIRIVGAWSREEEERLTRIVTEMTINQGKDPDSEVFWGRVSELMGGTRGRQQCRIKWTDALSKSVKSGGQKARWSQRDAYILVQKLSSLNVRDDTEIDWKLISDPSWNLWSAHTLQRRWLTMKRSIKGYEDMTYQEIMDILRLKKAPLPDEPEFPVKKRKERKVKSAALVEEDEPTLALAIAGPSTGPGTLTAQSDDETSSSSSDSD
ncbi:hypothetical protein H0H92_010994 [Tricholoma furcatifolium]|nr:hypothetical protein H0H92_010994 [Tricholoma furcatifolium]